MAEAAGVTLAPGALRSEFAALRRQRALFRLSLEGDNGLCMSSSPAEYVVAAWYDDSGYRNEGVRARCVAVDRLGRARPVAFDGGPEGLLEAMEAACAEIDAAALTGAPSLQ